MEFIGTRKIPSWKQGLALTKKLQKRLVFAVSEALFTTQTLPKGSIFKSKMLILCGIPPHLFHLMLLFSYRFQKL